MSERDIQGLFFSAKVKESTLCQNFFLSLNNSSKVELSKVAKGLRTIVRRLGKAQIIFRFDFLSAKKEMLVQVYFFSASKERKERVGGSALKNFCF